MKRMLGRLAVPFGAVAALVAATATPAAAATDARANCSYTYSNKYGGYSICGYAVFESQASNGNETLTVVDYNDDGLGVAVQNYRFDLADTGPYLGTVGGTGQSKTYTLHMPEGSQIKFRVCAYTTAHGIYSDICGDWVTGTA